MLWECLGFRKFKIHSIDCETRTFTCLNKRANKLEHGRSSKYMRYIIIIHTFSGFAHRPCQGGETVGQISFLFHANLAPPIIVLPYHSIISIFEHCSRSTPQYNGGRKVGLAYGENDRMWKRIATWSSSPVEKVYAGWVLAHNWQPLKCAFSCTRTNMHELRYATVKDRVVDLFRALACHKVLGKCSYN